MQLTVAVVPISSNPVCGPCDSFPCTLHERIKNSCTEFQGEKSMIICDLCGDAKDCLQKEIEGKEYDICSEYWNPFTQKLEGERQCEESGNCVLATPKSGQTTRK